LTAGKPALVLPQAGDQFRNAALLEKSGAAAVRRSERRHELADAIGQALGSAELSQRAKYVAGENAALPAVQLLARDIAACAPS
jgi:UDP:flavonoid glycosyltransferase YjiC (YdhE family)